MTKERKNRAHILSQIDLLSDIFYTMNKIEKGMYILQEKVDSKSKWDFMRKIRCYFYVNAPIKK